MIMSLRLYSNLLLCALFLKKKIAVNSKVNGFLRRCVGITVTTKNKECLNIFNNQMVVSSCKIKSSLIKYTDKLILFTAIIYYSILTTYNSYNLQLIKYIIKSWVLSSKSTADTKRSQDSSRYKAVNVHPYIKVNRNK